MMGGMMVHQTGKQQWTCGSYLLKYKDGGHIDGCQWFMGQL